MTKIFSTVKLSYVGIFLTFLSALTGIMVYSLTARIKQLNALLHEGCTLPEAICPFKTSIPNVSVLSYVIASIVFFIGVYLIISDRKDEIVNKKKQLEARRISESLEGHEKNIYDLIAKADGVMFQSEVVEKSGLTKVKVTRLLDKLESKNLIERKRRGMSNVVVLR